VTIVHLLRLQASAGLLGEIDLEQIRELIDPAALTGLDPDEYR
jgi:hypothetical protein